VVGVDLLSAAGRLLVALPGPDVTFPPAVTVLRAGGVSVRATGFLRVPCISVGTEACGPTVDGIVGVTAPCAPRRIVVTAVLDARSTGLEIRLRDGRTARARVGRLPAVAGRRRVAVVVLPAAATPVRLLLLRRGGSRPPLSRPFALPPAARQCGYTGATGSLERAGPAR
jgi:hypothetical protein